MRNIAHFTILFTILIRCYLLDFLFISFFTLLLHWIFCFCCCCFIKKITVHLLKNIIGQQTPSTLFHVFLVGLFPLSDFPCLDGPISSSLQNLFHLSLFCFLPIGNQKWTGFPQRIQPQYYLRAFEWFQYNFLCFLFFTAISVRDYLGSSEQYAITVYIPSGVLSLQQAFTELLCQSIPPSHHFVSCI